MIRPIEHLGVATALPSDQLDALRTIDPDVAAVVIVDGAGVADRADLMMRFVDAFALPSGGDAWTWPALADAVWGALHRMGASRVLVVLTHADELAGRSMDELVALVLLFADLDRQVSPEEGSRRSIGLSLVLLGDGPAFS